MRLVYTLIASGLLILTEVVAEQPPPPVPDQVTVSTFDSGGTAGNSSPSSKAHFIDLESHSSLEPNVVSGLPGYLFPSKAAKDDFVPRQPPSISGDRLLQDGPAVSPINFQFTMAAVPAEAPVEASSNALSGASIENAPSSPAAQSSYSQQSVLPVTGYAMYYNPEVMTEVLTNRLRMGHVTVCNECVGSVALLRVGDLNRRVWLQWADGTVEGPFLVADVAASQHVASLLARNWVVDVDYRTAMRHGMFNPVWVTVWAAPPSTNQPSSTSFATQTPWPTAVNSATDFPWPTLMPADTPTPWPTAVNRATEFPWPTLIPADTQTPWPTPVNSSVAYATATATPEATRTPWPTPTPLAPATPMPWPTPTSVDTLTPWPTAVNHNAEYPTSTPVPAATQTPWPSPTTAATQASWPTAVNSQTQTPLPPTAIPENTQASWPTPTPTATQTPWPTPVNHASTSATGGTS